jgi:choline dehydrogenase-like flavoprotein
VYDYVIVGGGAAGCVLARRLSDDSDVSVLLLEAGPPDTAEEIFVPAAFAKLFRSPLDWDYLTEPEPHADGRQVYIPRGRVLGGSSSINAMVYIRGNRADYDGWAARGLRGWSYDQVLPYFKRAEDNERGANEFHGVGGPLAVSDSRSRNPLMAAFVEAAVEAGIPANPDFNGAEQEGAGLYQVTCRNGMRCSAAAAYLRPIEGRENLEIRTGALATRVVLERGRAVGVEALVDGQPHVFQAEREVIVSGGAYNTPQLLMLSGIGPADHLHSIGIEVLHELPVGDNLQDHPSVGFTYMTDEPVSLFEADTEENLVAFMQGQGPLTSNVAEAGLFWRSRDDLPAPDIQFHAAPAMFIEEGLVDPPGHGYTFGPCLVAPRSVGEVRLASNDPTAKPSIRHNYLAEQEDVDALVAGLKLAAQIGDAAPLAERYRTGTWEPPASLGDDDLAAYVRAKAQTLYHPVGTCAMGAVVDDELRVLGIEGLRVVDASVMPTVPRGNTNAPTILVAERAADLIRGLAPAAAEEAAAA